ncbi:hypothetical protein ACFV9D_31985 [Streptomyces sp. NPDC059875]|uniref:HflX-like GTP-binding protein n=1 Tax=unclassified Streptomyces TaxID=2593676 RepID=UPI00365A8F15
MRTYRRRGRRLARRAGASGAGPTPAPDVAVAGADLVLVGFFSARRKDFAALMDAAAGELTAGGGRVVGRVVQRRGVSSGGVRKMALPYSSRTVFGNGKVREAAELCERTRADAVVFLTPLTERQCRVLSEIFGCPVIPLVDVLPAPAP